MRFLDRFRWRRRSRARIEQAQEADERASQHLRDVLDRAPEVEQESAWVTYTYQRNHLTQRFLQNIGKGHS